jgi:hypothetical protein
MSEPNPYAHLENTILNTASALTLVANEMARQDKVSVQLAHARGTPREAHITVKLKPDQVSFVVKRPKPTVKKLKP